VSRSFVPYYAKSPRVTIHSFIHAAGDIPGAPEMVVARPCSPALSPLASDLSCLVYFFDKLLISLFSSNKFFLICEPGSRFVFRLQ